MFDQISKLAEQTATSLSRRSFLTRAGLGAAAVFTFVSNGFANNKNCVLNGNGCTGAAPYYNKTTGTCCGNSTCGCCQTPGDCVLNGGCCTGPVYQYYNTTTHACYKSPYCLNGCADKSGCAPSACCGGGGACGFNVCYSDRFCNTPC